MDRGFLNWSLAPLRFIFGDQSAKRGNADAKPGDQMVNYLWINQETFHPSDDVKCGLPLTDIDRIISNAKKYSNTSFRFWIDSDMLDDNGQSRQIVEEHIRKAGVENIDIHDLRDIPSYCAAGIFVSGGETIDMKVDYARLLVLRHTLEETQTHQVFYADTDIRDLKLHHHRTQTPLNRFGFVFGCLKHNLTLENQFFGFSNDERLGILDRLIDLTRAQFEQNLAPHDKRNGWGPLLQISNETSKPLGRTSVREIATPVCEPQNQGKLQTNPIYVEQGLNPPRF